jgi:hypothetical protein
MMPGAGLFLDKVLKMALDGVHVVTHQHPALFRGQR